MTLYYGLALMFSEDIGSPDNDCSDSVNNDK